MPENQIPAAQPEPGSAAGEFEFAQTAKENPRIRRRSLKAKSGGLPKPADGAPPAARELEREAPPLSAEQVVKPSSRKAGEVKKEPAVKIAESAPASSRPTPTRTAPPRTTPSPPSGSALPTTASTSATSPHGTRPATLYYSSHPRTADLLPPMKTTPTASPTSSSSATTLPSSVARSAAASPRPATTIDYRANMDRQSREQKSVGSILAYAVYALIAFFVVSAGLAAYGADVIFKQLHEQSVTVSDVDQRYAAVTKDLNAKLVATQDILNQAQAQITRQQDLILTQQEELNRLIAATNDNVNALKLERQARTQETASLRARVRDLEYRPTLSQKF